MGYSKTQKYVNDRQNATDDVVADGIGWTSVAIGLAEMFATRKLERVLGIGNGRQHTGILQTLGARELLHGFDLLSHRDPTPGMWARVAGDVLDTALLGIAARKTRNPSGFGMAFAMVLGIGVLDLLFASHLSKKKSGSNWQ